MQDSILMVQELLSFFIVTYKAPAPQEMQKKYLTRNCVTGNFGRDKCRCLEQRAGLHRALGGGHSVS